MSVYYNFAIAVENENKDHTLIVGKSTSNRFLEYNYLSGEPDDLLSCLKHNDKFYYGSFCDYTKDPYLNKKNIKETDKVGFWSGFFDVEALFKIDDDGSYTIDEFLSHITAYDFTSDDDGLNDLVLENDTTKLRTNIIDKKYTKDNRKTYPKEICTVDKFIKSTIYELKTNEKMQDMFDKFNLSNEELSIALKENTESFYFDLYAATEYFFILRLLKKYLGQQQNKSVYFDNSIIINKNKKEYIDFLHANFTLIYYKFLKPVKDKNTLETDNNTHKNIYYVHPLAFLCTDSTDDKGIEKTNDGKSGDMIKGTWFNDELIIDRERNFDLTGYKNLTPLDFLFK